MVFFMKLQTYFRNINDPTKSNCELIESSEMFAKMIQSFLNSQIQIPAKTKQFTIISYEKCKK